jgi:choline kinase
MVEAAVILVAGIGSRLRPITDTRPKALAPVGDETILGRGVRLLLEFGISRLILATGYREDAVKAAVAGLPCEVVLCPNPRYDTTQNSVSLALCRDAVGGRSFFKLDGDVVFDPEILERIAAPVAELAVGIDSSRNHRHRAHRGSRLESAVHGARRARRSGGDEPLLRGRLFTAHRARAAPS